MPEVKHGSVARINGIWKVAFNAMCDYKLEIVLAGNYKVSYTRYHKMESRQTCIRPAICLWVQYLII